MASEDCPPGRKWDRLVRTCVLSKSETRPEPETSTELPPMGQLRSTAPTAQAHSVMLLSPALWIFVVLATLGSILVLALWFIIYKQQTRHSSTPADGAVVSAVASQQDVSCHIYCSRSI